MNPYSLTESEWRGRKAVIMQQRCIACGSTLGVIPHHEPNGCHKNDRRAVPLCFKCHTIRHSPTPNQGIMSQIIRNKSLIAAREIDAVFTVWKLIEGKEQKC